MQEQLKKIIEANRAQRAESQRTLSRVRQAFLDGSPLWEAMEDEQRIVVEGVPEEGETRDGTGSDGSAEPP